MKLLFFGDLAGTGFGTVTMDMGRELLALGHDVRFVSQNELGDLAEPFASRTLSLSERREGWLAAGDFSPAKIVEAGAWPDAWEPEAIVLLGDFYAARLLVFMDETGEEMFRRIPTFHYVPVEGVGLPPAWAKLWSFVRPIAMSEFGADEIQKIMGSRPPVIYHGVSQDFYPATATRPIRLGSTVIRSKAEAREYFHVDPKARVVLRTDANWPRKRYASLMRAMAPVLLARPDVLLVMHCRSSDPGGDLRDLHSHFPPAISQQMVNTGYHDRGFLLDRPTLCALYNMADVYASTSAEGFGLTIAEALACGVPAVGANYSAVPEVIGKAGVVVPVELIDNEYGHFWCAVDEDQFGNAVGEMLDSPRERGLLAAQAVTQVRTKFSWPVEAGKLASYLESSI